MSIAPHPSWFLGKGTLMWRQQMYGYLGRIMLKMTKESYYNKGLSSLLNDLFHMSRGIR